MNRSIYLAALGAAFSLMACGAVRDPASYCDLFTGTAATGHTTPAACVPFGRVQPGPETGNGDWAYCSGYQFADQTVIGYSQNHISGSGCTDLGDAQILPFTGRFSVLPSYRAIDKSSERAEPGYYTVIQSNDRLKVEITATKRVAIYRITALEGEEIKLLVNPSFGINAGWYRYKNKGRGELDLSVNGTIRGGYERTAWVKDRTVGYAIVCNRPWKSVERLPLRPDETLESCVATFAAKELLVKVSLSMTSPEAAEKNIAAELPGWAFDEVRASARNAWNDLLSRTPAEGSETELKNWYTSLYHLYYQPNDYSDFGEEPYFTTLSLWDTFRAAQPWYTIVTPEIIVPEIKSMLKLWRKHGNLPRMSYGGGYVDCMIGEHMLPVIADAYLKGFRGFDIHEAFVAMTNTVTVAHPGRAKEDWPVYAKYGYLPFDLVKHESCSRVLETSFDDWCLARYAEAIGEKEAAAFFLRRSENWKNIFDTSLGFARGKDSQGRWLEPFDPYAFGHETTVVGCFTEGNSFQYSWHVLQDVPGLMEAMGGRQKMVERLDRLFVAEVKAGFKSCDITGLIGQYVHGNEPSHHIIYFYPQIGHPEKAAERVREVFDRFYFPGPDGLSGNDDCGQMSAWYVFSAMGFYPFNPCSGEYVLCAPQLPKMQMKLRDPSGAERIFTVLAKNLSRENKYVKSVTLNGKAITDWKIRHDQILAGGELAFEMTSKEGLSCGN